MNKDWDQLWLNVNLATMNGDDYGIIENAAIACKGEHIAWLGPMGELPGKPDQLAVTVHHMQGEWITPGLIDCHTHLVYAGNRAHEFEQRLQGMSYAEIAKQGGGIRSTVQATRAANEAELYDLASARLQHWLAEGVTTIEIKSGYGLDETTELTMLKVARELGARHPITTRATYLGAHTLPDDALSADDYIQFVCETMLPKLADNKLADAIDVFCENIAFTPLQTEHIFQAAEKHKLPVKIHAEQLSDQGGAALAAKYHALSADHLEYLSETGIKAMADNDTVAVLLPGAFYFLQETQLPPIARLRQHQVPIAIATDHNPGSSPVNSILLMLNMACTLFGLTPAESLAGITRHAAKALGLSATHGSLSVNKLADLAIWNINHPVELSYQIGANPLQSVIYHGEYR